MLLLVHPSHRSLPQRRLPVNTQSPSSSKRVCWLVDCTWYQCILVWVLLLMFSSVPSCYLQVAAFIHFSFTFHCMFFDNGCFFPFLLRHLAERCGEKMVRPLRTLVQHVCVKTPDRAEYRGKLAKIVVQLIDLFSNEQYSLMLEWIDRFSRNFKVLLSLSCECFWTFGWERWLSIAIT